MEPRQMNPITRALWDRDLTVKKWAALNGFSAPYVLAVIAGRRGAYMAGTAKKIIAALTNQGFIQKEAE